jgi:type II secretory pathway pseudopilin PulG
MGGIILILLLGIVVVILLTPAMRARARRQRDDVAKTAHEAVVKRLDDHRARRSKPTDDKAKPD